jgi:hypothetical protein
MTPADIYAEDFPHGTPAGFTQGCRGSKCANHGSEWPTCKEANLRYQGDYVYRRRVDAGMTLAELRTADQRDAVNSRPHAPGFQRTARPPAETETPADIAFQRVVEAQRVYGLRAGAIGEEQVALFALRATSLAEYVAAVSLATSRRHREYAADHIAEADRRRPSGRKAHTTAESEELRESAAERLGRAEAAEALALSALEVAELSQVEVAAGHLLESAVEAGTDARQTEWETALDLTKRVRAYRDKLRKWTFVRGRAEKAPQRYGGLLPLIFFERHEFGGAPLSRLSESGNPGTISSAVELIARWDLAGDPRADEEPSAAALEAIRGVRRGEYNDSGFSHLAVMQRNLEWNADDEDEFEWLEGDGDETLAHIAEMRRRVSAWFDWYGRPLQPRTVAVHSEQFHLNGHIDFLSADTVWDLKVSETAPGRADILQLLLYWLILRDDPENSPVIAFVGLYNPRSDIAWRIAVADIPRDVVVAVEAIAASEHP